MNDPAPAESGRCPVCQARFRGEAICSRCGADLTPLMLLVTRAYSLRQAARQALQAGDEQTALAAAEAAQDLHATSRGSLFLLMSAALLVVVTHWVRRPKANRHRRNSLD